MGQRSNYAAGKDVLIEPKKEECVKGMEHRSNYAAAKDAQIMLKKEVCASSMEPTAFEISTKFCQRFSTYSMR